MAEGRRLRWQRGIILCRKLAMNIWRIVLYPLRLFVDAWGYAVGDGTWWLRSYELRLIEISATELSIENKKILQRQLSSLFYVQRLHNDRITLIDFHWRDRIERMSLPSNYRLAKITLRHDQRSVTTSIETVDGLIYALKYSAAPRPIVLTCFQTPSIEYGGSRDDEITRSIDREEHGNSGDTEFQ